MEVFFQIWKKTSNFFLFQQKMKLEVFFQIRKKYSNFCTKFLKSWYFFSKFGKNIPIFTRLSVFPNLENPDFFLLFPNLAFLFSKFPKMFFWKFFGIFAFFPNLEKNFQQQFSGLFFPKLEKKCQKKKRMQGVRIWY